jgi:hypothetical protein
MLYQGNPDSNHKLWNCFVTVITDWNGMGQTTIDELWGIARLREGLFNSVLKPLHSDLIFNRPVHISVFDSKFKRFTSFNENNKYSPVICLMLLQLVNFLFAINLSSDFLQGSNACIYI